MHGSPASLLDASLRGVSGFRTGSALHGFQGKMLLMQSSLADLNTRLPQQLPMNRFRPNIVVDDSVAPWAEDNWQVAAGLCLVEMSLRNICSGLRAWIAVSAQWPCERFDM